MDSINEADDGMDEENQRRVDIPSPSSNTTPPRPSRSLHRPSTGKLGAIPIVSEVLVTFPLPGKDPLLEYRKMHDFAQAFNVDDDSSRFFK